jgi:ADP-ribosyl-[dinitrogen reductase] hydrolase
MAPALHDRLSGGLIGLLVGDALGVPYEFHSPADLPSHSELDFSPPPHFSRSHSSVPPGTWSDDGAQALCLLSTLLECGSLDLSVFSKKLLDWFHNGAFTPDQRIFDCGLQTHAALRNLNAGVPPERSGPSGEWDNGNGSLMRVLPLALWHCGSDEDLYAAARRQSLVTHGHLRAQLCCAFYVLWARELLRGSPDGWKRASEKFLSFGRVDPATLQESEFILAISHCKSASGSGYVLNSRWSARGALEQHDYESVVRAAIAFGNDTDTTACIAGGLAGIRHGLQAIPDRWRNSLRGHEIYEPLLQNLLRVVPGM